MKIAVAFAYDNDSINWQQMPIHMASECRLISEKINSNAMLLTSCKTTNFCCYGIIVNQHIGDV